VLISFRLILDLIVAGYLIATGHLLAGFLLLLIPLLMSLILCCWPEAAAKFAAICLETVVNFIDFFPATVYIALGFVLLQVCVTCVERAYCCRHVEMRGRNTIRFC